MTSTLRALPVLLCAVALGARADIPPADTIGCRDKQTGAPCTTDDKQPGACVTSTCTRRDYSSGPPPKSVEYECLKCAAGAAVTAPEAPPAPVQQKSAPKKSGCASVPGESLLAMLALLGVRRRRMARALIPERSRRAWSLHVLSGPLLVVLLAAPAFADIPPSNSVQCRGKSAGAACTTDEGAAGTCISQKVSRPDYSEGPPPKWVEVDMMLCVATAPAATRVTTSAMTLWLGAALALLAAAGALFTRRREPPRPA